ncbi:hypothetical protein BC941DRAFT_416742, partial [Chlamydoabsidia padenii]
MPLSPPLYFIVFLYLQFQLYAYFICYFYILLSFYSSTHPVLSFYPLYYPFYLLLSCPISLPLYI